MAENQEDDRLREEVKHLQNERDKYRDDLKA